MPRAAAAYGAAMFVVIYRWKLRTGREERFVEAWSAMTRSIRDQCGSFGSRLHASSDGTWVAYAQWPDEKTWRECSPDNASAGEGMASSIEEDFEPLRLTTVADLLTNPG